MVGGGSRKGSKGNAVGLDNAAAAPATVSGELSTDKPLGTAKVSGKVVEGDDPQARRPATNRGHARTHWAGCPDVETGRTEPRSGEAQAAAVRGDGFVPQVRRVRCSVPDLDRPPSPETPGDVAGASRHRSARALCLGHRHLRLRRARCAAGAPARARDRRAARCRRRAAASSALRCATPRCRGPRSSPRRHARAACTAAMIRRASSPAAGKQPTSLPAGTTRCWPRPCRACFAGAECIPRALPRLGAAHRGLGRAGACTARAACASPAACRREWHGEDETPGIDVVLRALAPSARPHAIAFVDWTFSGVVQDLARLAAYLADRLGWPHDSRRAGLARASRSPGEARCGRLAARHSEKIRRSRLGAHDRAGRRSNRSTVRSVVLQCDALVVRSLA